MAELNRRAGASSDIFAYHHYDRADLERRHLKRLLERLVGNTVPEPSFKQSEPAPERLRLPSLADADRRRLAAQAKRDNRLNALYKERYVGRRTK